MYTETTEKPWGSLGDPGHPTAVQLSPPPARTIGIWWSVDKTLKATAESRLTFDQSRARPRSIPLVGKDPVAQVHMKHVQVCLCNIIYMYMAYICLHTDSKLRFKWDDPTYHPNLEMWMSCDQPPGWSWYGAI